MKNQFVEFLISSKNRIKVKSANLFFKLNYSESDYYFFSNILNSFHKNFDFLSLKDIDFKLHKDPFESKTWILKNIIQKINKKEIETNLANSINFYSFLKRNIENEKDFKRFISDNNFLNTWLEFSENILIEDKNFNIEREKNSNGLFFSTLQNNHKALKEMYFSLENLFKQFSYVKSWKKGNTNLLYLIFLEKLNSLNLEIFKRNPKRYFEDFFPNSLPEDYENFKFFLLKQLELGGTSFELVSSFFHQEEHYLISSHQTKNNIQEFLFENNFINTNSFNVEFKLNPVAINGKSEILNEIILEFNNTIKNGNIFNILTNNNSLCEDFLNSIIKNNPEEILMINGNSGEFNINLKQISQSTLDETLIKNSDYHKFISKIFLNQLKSENVIEKEYELDNWIKNNPEIFKKFKRDFNKKNFLKDLYPLYWEIYKGFMNMKILILKDINWGNKNFIYFLTFLKDTNKNLKIINFNYEFQNVNQEMLIGKYNFNTLKQENWFQLIPDILLPIKTRIISEKSSIEYTIWILNNNINFKKWVNSNLNKINSSWEINTLEKNFKEKPDFYIPLLKFKLLMNDENLDKKIYHLALKLWKIEKKEIKRLILDYSKQLNDSSENLKSTLFLPINNHNLSERAEFLKNFEYLFSSFKQEEYDFCDLMGKYNLKFKNSIFLFWNKNFDFLSEFWDNFYLLNKKQYWFLIIWKTLYFEKKNWMKINSYFSNFLERNMCSLEYFEHEIFWKILFENKKILHTCLKGIDNFVLFISQSKNNKWNYQNKKVSNVFNIPEEFSNRNFENLKIRLFKDKPGFNKNIKIYHLFDINQNVEKFIKKYQCSNKVLNLNLEYLLNDVTKKPNLEFKYPQNKKLVSKITNLNQIKEFSSFSEIFSTPETQLKKIREIYPNNLNKNIISSFFNSNFVEDSNKMKLFAKEFVKLFFEKYIKWELEEKLKNWKNKDSIDFFKQISKLDIELYKKGILISKNLGFNFNIFEFHSISDRALTRISNSWKDVEKQINIKILFPEYFLNLFKTGDKYWDLYLDSKFHKLFYKNKNISSIFI